MMKEEDRVTVEMLSQGLADLGMALFGSVLERVGRILEKKARGGFVWDDLEGQNVPRLPKEKRLSHSTIYRDELCRVVGILAALSVEDFARFLQHLGMVVGAESYRDSDLGAERRMLDASVVTRAEFFGDLMDDELEESDE